MSLILNIDTSLENASVALAMDGEVVALADNNEQKDHAAWIHTAIDALLHQTGYTLHQLKAVAVSIGPGSYTGLRIGLASAKGFCYALSVPLLTVGTLEMIAHSIKEQVTDLVCPVIDARRMEIYAAVYDKKIVEKIPPFAAVLESESFSDLLLQHKIIFSGNSNKKLQSLLTHPHASFATMGKLMHSLSCISYKNYTGNKFAVLAYTEPLYLKEFYIHGRK